MPLHDREVSVKEASDREAVKKQEDGVIVKVDEATMKARFQDWMEQYGWSYRTEKEKARRHSDDFDWERYIDHINIWLLMAGISAVKSSVSVRL